MIYIRFLKISRKHFILLDINFVKIYNKPKTYIKYSFIIMFGGVNYDKDRTDYRYIY